MYKFKIPSLKCKGCFHNIEESLKKVYPDIPVTVDLANKTVLVDSLEPQEKLSQLIEAAGYPVEEVL